MRIDPRHRLLQHVDLFALKSGEEVTVEVPIHTTGESYAVVRLGGTLLHNVDHVRVRALPEKLPEALTFSIESLTEFDMQIHLREVELPEGVTLLSDPDEVVAKVIAPRVEEVAAPTEEAAEEAAPAADAKAADKD
jgi:large subunit ribosomal protein L25